MAKTAHTQDELRTLYHDYSEKEFEQQLQQIVVGIRAVLRVVPVKSHVKYRVKSFNEYYKKWNATGGDTKTPIGDMLGVRVVCPFLDDLYTVEQALNKKLSISDIDRKGVERSFREFGYESTHLVLDLNRETIAHPLPGVAPVCEIQLRTILQDAWAEVEHQLIYKSDWSIPTDQIRRKLAALNANLSLSDVIFQELRDFQKEVQRKQEKRREIQNIRGNLVPSDELNKKLDSDPSDGEEEQREDLEKLVLRALTAHSDEAFGRAIRLYSRILLLPKSDPIRAIIFNHRGMAYFAIGECNAARSDYKAALAIDNLNFRAWYNLGLAHQAVGDTNWALDAFAKCVKIEPSFFDGQLQYIRALIERKEIPSAYDAIKALSQNHASRPEIIAQKSILDEQPKIEPTT